MTIEIDENQNLLYIKKDGHNIRPQNRMIERFLNYEVLVEQVGLPPKKAIIRGLKSNDNNIKVELEFI